MNALSPFPVAGRWIAQHPERLQLYSFPTPNGIKVSAMLEETGLPYEPHTISIRRGDQTTPEFLALNPNNKIPAIVDPDGPGGKPLALFESGAILVYLAEKTGKLLPEDPAARYETIQWLMFQMGGVGPMFGQFGHFHKFMAGKLKDAYPTERYQAEARRLYNVLEQRLDGRDWIMGDEYTIADIASWPWFRTMTGFYEAGEALGVQDYPNVQAWLDRALERPASQRSLTIPDPEG